MVRCMGLLAVTLSAVWFLAPVAQGQSTLKLSATLTIEKSDDKAKTNEQIQQLLSHAKQMKYEGNVQRFLENMVNQVQKVIETAKVVEEKKSTEVPKTSLLQSIAWKLCQVECQEDHSEKDDSCWFGQTIRGGQRSQLQRADADHQRHDTL